jgi:hypothetical protein
VRTIIPDVLLYSVPIAELVGFDVPFVRQPNNPIGVAVEKDVAFIKKQTRIFFFLVQQQV